MPLTSPYAIAQVSVNGGAPQQGGLTVHGGDTIQLSVTNSSLLTSIRWEIYAYPEGWPTPAGWTLDATTGIIYSTDTTPTLITLEVVTTRWGKWLVRVIGNGGTKNGVSPVFDASTGSYLTNDLIDIASGWQVKSPNYGIEEPGLFEGTQFGLLRRWTAALQRMAHSIDSALFGPAGQQVQSFAATVATTDATPTAFATGGLPFTVPDKTAVDVVVTIVGKKAATADTFCQDYRARYYRNGGAVTLIGSVIAGSNPVATGGLATATATILLSGNTVAPQVTGVAATSATWTATMQVQPATTGT